MTFEEILEQAIAMLQRRGRLTYRALKRQFDLDDAYLDDLKHEIIEGQRLAVDEHGTVLIWTGTADPVLTSATVPERAPLAYTPPHLTEKILTARAALEGERKQVTVLFADIKGSTELIASLDPEAARRLLDPALHLMMEAVHRYEGTVNQVIDRLPLEEKQLLQTAAVIGTEMPLLLLQAIAEQPEDVLYRSLTHLQTAEFLYETRLFPEREFTFKHALTHEVAYGSLLQERRQALHARIVEALEALAGDRVADQIERLAHHALRGEVCDKALAYCRQAGEKAMTQSAYREAVWSFEQALCALPHLPEERDTLEQAIDLRLALRSALIVSGDWERALAYLREAETLSAALDDQRRLGRVSRFLARSFQ